MRSLPIFFIPLLLGRAAILAGFGLAHDSRESALLCRWSFARLFFRAADFDVSSYSSVRSLLQRSPEIPGAVVVCRLGLLRFVAKSAANLTFEWDRPEAACPSI
jgi:hypothetical protein